MPTLEKEAQLIHATDKPGFQRFMHEWEEKLHHQIEAEEQGQHEEGAEPQHKKAA